MKSDFAHMDKYRYGIGDLASPKGSSFGVFRIVMRACVLQVISSGSSVDYPQSQGWEHVSVSIGSRCPT